MTNAPDVIVVGGGAIGLAVAWYAARGGVSVELYERGPLAGEATGASAGILAPLAESSSPGPFVDLALAGLLAFRDDIDTLRDDSGLEPEYRRTGVLRLATDSAGVTELREAAAWQANAALDLRWLEPRQVAALEPGLAPCAGALLSPHEGHIVPARLAAALAGAAAGRGAVLRHYAPAHPWIENGQLAGVVVDGERRSAGRVVLAAGAWSSSWADAVGVTLPVRPVKGQMMLLRAVPRPLRHVVFVGHGYLVPRGDGTIYAGATQEETGFDRRVTVAGLRELAEMTAAILPALTDAEVVHTGTGLRPGIADGLPVLGPAPRDERLLLAAGHFRNGILMSLVTGRIIAAQLQGRVPEIDLAPFSAERFASVAAQ